MRDAAQPPVAPAWSACLPTPFATLGVRSNGDAVTEVAFLAPNVREQAPTDRIADQAVAELRRYLDDGAYRFRVPLAPRGTRFQRRVWDAIAAIPVRESRTYGDLAAALGSVARAVGQACGANPIALIVPCHRVVGSRGGLGGFMHMSLEAGDPLAIKRWLLAHEGYPVGASAPLFGG